MTDFDAELQRRLDALREQELLRELRRVDSPQSPGITVDGRPLLNFSSNDYLGLANDPIVKEAAVKAVEQFGAGAGASRLISGSLAPHHELDDTLAAFKGTEAALAFSSGYSAALGAIGALLGKDDVIIVDKLVHASIIDAARLCGARLRVFPHNDLNKLESHLKWAAALPAPVTPHLAHRTLVVTESIFSMDGDRAPLREMVALKERHGAWLMVDEAHAAGLYGAQRRGLAEEAGVSDRIEVHLGTLGKAFGSSGGFIAGSRKLIDTLVNRARSFIFSTAPVPAAAAAASAAVRFVQSNDGEARRKVLWQRVAELNRRLKRETLHPSAINPIRLGSEKRALDAAATLRHQGFFVPAIRFPTVARGTARLRVTITAAHTTAQIEQLAGALLQIANQKSKIAN